MGQCANLPIITCMLALRRFSIGTCTEGTAQRRSTTVRGERYRLPGAPHISRDRLGYFRQPLAVECAVARSGKPAACVAALSA